MRKMTFTWLRAAHGTPHPSRPPSCGSSPRLQFSPHVPSEGSGSESWDVPAFQWKADVNCGQHLTRDEAGTGPGSSTLLSSRHPTGQESKPAAAHHTRSSASCCPLHSPDQPRCQSQSTPLFLKLHSPATLTHHMYAPDRKVIKKNCLNQTQLDVSDRRCQLEGNRWRFDGDLSGLFNANGKNKCGNPRGPPWRQTLAIKVVSTDPSVPTNTPPAQRRPNVTTTRPHTVNAISYPAPCPCATLLAW